MPAFNDITGARLRTKAASQAYRDNWDTIFKKKKDDTDVKRHSGSGNVEGKKQGQSL